MICQKKKLLYDVLFFIFFDKYDVLFMVIKLIFLYMHIKHYIYEKKLIFFFGQHLICFIFNMTVAKV